ncbi:MAG: hypothetical protein M0R80_18555 [Proteobacteria bacterium]|jgi:hypothetical protein|nr:hypothetical protein [Pseudomonadota bacterium]
MAYAVVTWTVGDIITEAKLDQMIANIDSMRDGTGISDNVILTRHILDANVTDAKLAPTARLNSKVITATRDGAGATASVAYTGVGFRPTSILCLANVDASLYGSEGYADSTKAATCVYRSAANVTNQGGNIALYSNQSSWAQGAVVASYDADGFTLTWTKVGSPTAGTIKLVFICFR